MLQLLGQEVDLGGEVVALRDERGDLSLDLLHVSALVHDDVMDASDTRRGLPAAHRQFAAGHAGRGLRGDSDAFGRGGAILLGDLLLVWSQEMFRRSGLPAETIQRAMPMMEAVLTEVTTGQFLAFAGGWA